ncbi:MAG: hypothetical protein AMXMBFR84_06170 [Candidatus Hydrogenedentota bacterium]
MQDVTYLDTSLPPTRGLICLHNQKGKPFRFVDIARWIRLNRVAYKTAKLDLISNSFDSEAARYAADVAREMDARLSLRTAAAMPPPDPTILESLGLLDILLAPSVIRGEHVNRWLEAAHLAGLPIRIQITGPLAIEWDPESAAAGWAVAGVQTVHIAATDPFVSPGRARNAMATSVTLDRAAALARAATQHGMEANLIGWPFCVVPEDVRQFIVNDAQFYSDHQFYVRESYLLAQKITRMSPAIAGSALSMLLGRHTAYDNPIDRKLLPWLMDYPWAKARLWALHKLTRHHSKAPTPQPLAGSLTSEAREWSGSHTQHCPPPCNACALRRICDHAPAHLQRSYPDLRLQALPGDVAMDPFAFSKSRKRRLDALDADRLSRRSELNEMTARANSILQNTQPVREFGSQDYKVEGEWSWQGPGSVGWFSFTVSEKISTPLARLAPPFTLAYTVGGGIAEYVGFQFGRHATLMCPMTAYAHRIAIHVESDGRYVLLRDGVPQVPTEFIGKYYVPERLGNNLEPRIAIWNIDGNVGTQGVAIWQETQQTLQHTPRFSVVVVSTRYARRLQASLLSVARQQGVDRQDIEVLVAHVPGVDATPDVMDSIEAAYPGLRMIRVPFAPDHARAKGFMLNECMAQARGEWILIMDADIILPTLWMKTLGELPPETYFAAPDGRKMLTREATAGILIGEIQPSNQWNDLVNGPGEYRQDEADGIPVGFCQCFRRECLQKVRYEELQHFEGADWKFAKELIAHYGPVTRIAGVPVLHLDHGASNWYGAQRHF